MLHAPARRPREASPRKESARMTSTEGARLAPLKTGVSGLDDVLRSGLPPKCLFMMSGAPGTGKTTLAMQFLLSGVRDGERCLYVTLSESQREIAMVAESHGWDLRGLQICELIPSEQNLSPESQLTVFN